MRGRLGHLLFLALWLFSPAALMAQTITNDFGQSGLYYGVQKLKVVAGTVSTPQGGAIPHAWIEITNNAGAPLRSTQTDYRGIFQVEYNFMTDTEEVKHFAVSLKITRKGFEVAHRYVEIPPSKVLPIAITLRPVKAEDPALLSQANLIKSMGPRLGQIGPADALSPKDEKEYARGVQDFLEHNHVDQAVPHFEKVASSNPLCLRCRTMLGLAELSWGDWDDARRELGESVNAYIANRKLAFYEPLLVFGVMTSWDGDTEKASAYLAEAAKCAPGDAMVLQELARVQAVDLDWASASESLKKALDAGAGPEARLSYAEALSWTGTPSQAENELNLYLNGRDLKNMPPRVRSVWANIQARKKDQVALVAARAKAKGQGEEPLDYINHPPTKNFPDFQPATDQAPLQSILAAVGKNVADLFATIPNICSVEDVHQERLNRKGKTSSAQEYKYRYLLTTPNERWGPSIDEFRSDLRGNVTPQLGSSESYMLTSGFVSAPLVFHPAYQSGSTFRLLGRQKLNGRDTFVIAYAQEPARSRIYGSFQQGKTVSVTFSQGIAWIDSGNYQIVHLTSDLLRPAPLVRLDKETTEIDFGEVKFKKVTQQFWLPEEVKVTLDWNGKVLRNQHAYSDFLISNVDSSQKIAKPKATEKTAEEVAPLEPSAIPPGNPSLSLVPPLPKP